MKEILLAVSIPSAPQSQQIVTMETDYIIMRVLKTIMMSGIVMLPIIILMVVAYWNLFKKAGKSGWASIIPFYSSIVISKIAGVSVWLYLGVLLLTILGIFIPSISTITLIGYLLWNIIVSFKLPVKFGKGAGFGFGLLLLPIIFYPILAFGKSEYEG